MKIDEIRKRLEAGNSPHVRNLANLAMMDLYIHDVRYLLERLEKAEALLRTVNAAISRDDSYLDVGADIDDYFRSQTSEEK